ncbi:MAG TPA: hypothetical protein PL070_17520 [Flavobacteriales bacterium]|nr:hypothetical protein [Flavobacteriales bacterium]
MDLKATERAILGRNWNVVPPSKAVDSALPIFRVTKKTYTAAEVRALLDEVRLTFESDEHSPFLSQKEIARLDKNVADMKSGKVKGIPWEEVKKRLEKKMKTVEAGPKKAAKNTSASTKRLR